MKVIQTQINLNLDNKDSLARFRVFFLLLQTDGCFVSCGAGVLEKVTTSEGYTLADIQEQVHSELTSPVWYPYARFSPLASSCNWYRLTSNAFLCLSPVSSQSSSKECFIWGAGVWVLGFHIAGMLMMLPQYDHESGLNWGLGWGKLDIHTCAFSLKVFDVGLWRHKSNIFRLQPCF